MVKHHINYKTDETVEVSKSEHASLHYSKCAKCGDVGHNFLSFKVNLGKYQLTENREVIYGWGHWSTLCDLCLNEYTGKCLLFLELWKPTWPHKMILLGDLERRIHFIKEYIKRYPSKK
jgi:hypothetical protein